MTDLTAVAEIVLDDDSLEARIAGLGPRARKSLDEIVASIADLEEAGTDPILRRVVHRLFERSVNEFFTAETAQSTNLPLELIRFTVPDPTALPLPEPTPELEFGLTEALQVRRSQRNYLNTPLPLTELSDLLHHALGRNGTEDGYGTRDMPLQPYPSIGGLDPVDVGVVVNRVEGLRPGYYHYDKVGHGLIPELRGDLRMSLVNCTFDNEWLFYAPVVLVVVSNQDKVYWKYKTRGYRLSLLDQGAAMQNLYLVSTGLGLGCCAIAGYDDQKINQLFGYTAGDRSVSVLMTIGEPAKRAAGTRRN